jgi:hypothetical protein
MFKFPPESHGNTGIFLKEKNPFLGYVLEK